jgi:predicted dehydrogenase
MTMRLGVIGAGTIGRLHAEAASNIGVEIAGFCDVDKAAAKKAAAPYEGAVVTTSVDDLLELPDMPAVVVATPNSLHCKHAITALDAGKDVLLEKPMGLNAAECDRIIEAERRNERLVQLSFVCRCAPSTAVIERFIEAGRLGRIYHARATWFRRRGIPGLGGWFTTRASSGGGVLIDLGVHMIDLCLHHAGRPKPRRVSGICSSTFGAPIENYVYTEMWAGPPNFDGVFDVEDAAFGLIRCDDDLTLEVAAVWAANVPEQFLNSGIVLMGDKGGCYSDIWGDKLVFATEEERQLVDVTPLQKPGEKWMDAWQEQHRRFAEAVGTRTPPSASAAQGREVQAILDALYRSSEQRCEVEVE